MGVFRTHVGDNGLVVNPTYTVRCGAFTVSESGGTWAKKVVVK
jgi:hypothetical protein